MFRNNPTNAILSVTHNYHSSLEYFHATGNWQFRANHNFGSFFWTNVCSGTCPCFSM